MTSQSVAGGSSSTSLTGPDVIHEYSIGLLDAPCESGFEGSDTEADDDDAPLRPGPHRRFLSMLRRQPSYANVAAQATSQSSTHDESLDLWGGIGGMQRIVRNLARREDIPDEWWAEAGLSRIFSREAEHPDY